MKKADELLLAALKAALKKEKVQWEEPMEPHVWEELFRCARIHKILPLIYEAVYDCPAARLSNASSILTSYKKDMIGSVMVQIIKTREFLELYQKLSDEGVRAFVVKGLICRNLYPHPDYRPSGDEDLLISAKDFEKCNQVLQSFGMECADYSQDMAQKHEISYQKEGSPLYIELHKYLFPPESEVYGDMNRFFENVWERAVSVSIQGANVWTLHPTDHLCYLICHAFKHFLHSGFGIRQVSDIILFANSHGADIDWNQVLRQCRKIRADLFAASIFQIGEKYLVFDPVKAHYPKEWQEICVDEGQMLEDLMDAGIYGDGTMSRKHSSNITLDTVSAQKKGRNSYFTFLKSVFPPLQDMKQKYHCLNNYPCLLPVAWINRILKYRFESRHSWKNDAASSIAIGNRRVELFRRYKIID